MAEESKLVKVTEEEAKSLGLTPIDLSGRDLPLARDGSLMIMLKPADGKPVTVNSHYNVAPEDFEGQDFLPEKSSHYSVLWGPDVGGNMLQNGKQVYVKFY